MKKNILKMKRMKELRKKIQKKRKMIKSGSGLTRTVSSTRHLILTLAQLQSTNSKMENLSLTKNPMAHLRLMKLQRRKSTLRITGLELMV